MEAYGTDFISFGGRTLPGDEVASVEERSRIAVGNSSRAMGVSRLWRPFHR